MSSPRMRLQRRSGGRAGRRPASNAIQGHVAQVRRLIGREAIVTRLPGYLLSLASARRAPERIGEMWQGERGRRREPTPPIEVPAVDRPHIGAELLLVRAGRASSRAACAPRGARARFRARRNRARECRSRRTASLDLRVDRDVKSGHTPTRFRSPDVTSRQRGGDPVMSTHAIERLRSPVGRLSLPAWHAVWLGAGLVFGFLVSFVFASTRAALPLPAST
jgi:hypothetical protein